MASQAPLLTISLLISNRLDTIRRCLDSLCPLMEAIPSELILTDTSKNPEVNAICKEYTDQVYEFEWCHDFAKARNFGLEKASGEWFLFLDDDEWFVDVEELIEFFNSGEYKNYERATYLVRNYYDPEYVQYADCWVSRMNHITTESRFVGKVHEYMEPCIGAEKHIESMAYHSGYVFSTEEQRLEHAKRNITLLMEVLKEEPDNIRWQTQLAQEYRSAMDWESLVNYCKERLEKETYLVADEISKLQIGTFYAGLIDGLVRLGRFGECVSICEKVIEDKTVNPLLRAYAYIGISESHFELGDWDLADTYANKFLQEEQLLNETEVLSYEQKLVAIVQHVFDPSNLKKAYSILICNDLKQGSTKDLHQYYEKLEWNEVENFVYEPLPRYLVERMPDLNYEPLFSQIIADVFKREDFMVFMCREALKYEEQDFAHFQKLAYIFANVESDFWFVWYMRVLDTAARKDSALVEKFAGLEWESAVRSFLSQASVKQIDTARTALQMIFSVEAWQAASFEVMVLEKTIMDGPLDLGKLVDYYNVLKIYAEKDAILQSTAEVLDKIRTYIALETQDKVQALKSLKEAVNICPDFAEGISRYISCYSEFDRQRNRMQQEEMKKLKTEVIGQVKNMAANGQMESALAIIQQLKQMIPDDLDVATLSLELRLNIRDKQT